MDKLDNKTHFFADAIIMPDADGVDTVYVMVKASFDINPPISDSSNERNTLSLAQVQSGLHLEEQYFEKPGASSIRYARDVHPCKPGTDVALIGDAFAPHGSLTGSVDVSLRVADKIKTLRVFGDRVWQNGYATRPVPFDRMPIRYERAFGGVSTDKHGAVHTFPYNSIGCGYSVHVRSEALAKLQLPNVEDPGNLIAEPGDHPVPSGFGFIAANWLPRSILAGSFDDEWRRTRAPYLPKNYSAQFENCAHPDFIFDRYLNGNETIEIHNMSVDGRVCFELPCAPLSASMRAKLSEPRHQKMNIETITIDLLTQQVHVLWKTAFLCPSSFALIEHIGVCYA